MSYVDDNLLAGEQVQYTAKVHWAIYAPGAVALAAGLALWGAGGEGIWGLIGVALVVFWGLPALIRAGVQQWTTELVVTNQRVIAKVGLVRRQTAELNRGAAESFSLDQSISGRLMGYGTVGLRGHGGGMVAVPWVTAPLELRRAALGQPAEAPEGVAAR